MHKHNDKTDECFSLLYELFSSLQSKIKKEEKKTLKSIFRNVHILTEELICVNTPWS